MKIEQPWNADDADDWVYTVIRIDPDLGLIRGNPRHPRHLGCKPLTIGRLTSLRVAVVDPTSLGSPILAPPPPPPAAPPPGRPPRPPRRQKRKDGRRPPPRPAPAPTMAPSFSDITFTHVSRDEEGADRGRAHLEVRPEDRQGDRLPLRRAACPTGSSSTPTATCSPPRGRLRRPPRHQDRHEDRQGVHRRRAVRGPAVQRAQRHHHRREGPHLLQRPAVPRPRADRPAGPGRLPHRPPTASVHRIITDAGKPNGVAVSPDQKTLYVVSNDNGTTGIGRLKSTGNKVDEPLLKKGNPIGPAPH